MKLQLGRFYSSRRGDVWCCFKIDARARTSGHAARCVRVLDSRVETFFIDGRKEETGEDQNTLVAEVTFR